MFMITIVLFGWYVPFFLPILPHLGRHPILSHPHVVLTANELH